MSLRYEGDVVGSVLNCIVVVTEFEFQLHFYAHFGTNIRGEGMNYLIPGVMVQIIPLLFLNKDGFGIK